jgi:hypothetical protein
MIIVSGGQTGADQGALAAAGTIGLETDGWMPRGFRTQAGPRPDIAARYGLREHASPYYPPRPKANVLLGDATLVFGDPSSAGCRLTLRLCKQHSKPHHIVCWPQPIAVDFVAVNSTFVPVDQLNFREWLWVHAPTVLNVAGNREESNPGIHDACRDFLVAALGGGRCST